MSPGPFCVGEIGLLCGFNPRVDEASIAVGALLNRFPYCAPVPAVPQLVVAGRRGARLAPLEAAIFKDTVLLLLVSSGTM